MDKNMKNLEKIVMEVKTELGEDMEIRLQEVGKNNGCIRQTIQIYEPDSLVGVVIYLDDMLREIREGEMDAKTAAERIVDIYRDQSENSEMLDTVRNFRKEDILDRVVYQLVNREKNADLLAEIPYRNFLDMAVVYRVSIKADGKYVGSILVTNGFCKTYNIHFEELEASAKQNTEKEGFFTKALSALVGKMLGKPDMPETPDMWVVSNPDCINGAAVMLYKEEFQSMADKLESDLFVLPSSIHEVIVVPADREALDNYKTMVREINETEVDPEEVLTDSVYHYNRKAGMLAVA